MSITPNDILAALFESSVRAALFIVAIGALLAVLRVRAGSVRHAAWTAGLVAMLLLPVLPKWLPAIPVTLPMPTLTAATETTESTPQPVVSVRASTTPAQTAPVPAVSRPGPVRDASSPAPVGSATPVDWSLILVAIWTIGALVMLARLGMGWRYAARLAAGSRPAFARLPSARATAGKPDDLPLFESDFVATPVTVGVFRPRIILPIASRAWPADVRETVLLHERAHIRRRDTLINVLARFNRSVFWLWDPLESTCRHASLSIL